MKGYIKSVAWEPCANGVKCEVVGWVKRIYIEVVWPHGKNEKWKRCM